MPSNEPVTIAVSELFRGRRFQHAAYHRDGTLMLLPHAAIDASVLAALKAAGIDEFFICETEEAARSLRQAEGLAEVDPSEISLDVPAEKNLYTEDGELVCARGRTLDGTVHADMLAAGKLRLYKECSFYEAVRERYEEALAREVARTLDEMTDDTAHLRVTPGAEPFLRQCRRLGPAERTRDGVEAARRRHAMALASTCGLLERARREGKIDLPAAHELAKEVLERMAEDLPLSLATAETAIHQDYLVDHSLAVAMHAMAMGMAMGYDRFQCVDLGLGGLLHDVGMTTVNEQLIEKRGPLDPNELAAIRNHPKAGVEMALRTPGAVPPLPYAIYQDHERDDGRGYPAGAANGHIHDHSRIIAVADVYQAMTGPRPYKPRRSPHRAAMQLLRMVQEEVLGPEAVRAFLSTHGLFPVGSWVRLSDYRIARVVDSSPEQYDRPVVTAVADSDGTPLLRPETLDLSREQSLGVLEEAEMKDAAFDFAAGLHLEPVARKPADSKGPSGSGSRRKVPTEFIDWSASFSGYLTDFGVLDLVRVVDVSQKSGTLVLRFEGSDGLIRFHAGEMLSAEHHLADGRAIKDEEAIYSMVGLREGTFRFEQAVTERRRSVRLNNTLILMEACRRIDEGKK